MLGPPESSDEESNGDESIGAGPEPIDRAEYPSGSPWRARIWEKADRRQVPLATIVVAVVVTVVVLDVNALLILLLWVLRTTILYVVMGGFVALLLSPLVRFVERSGISRGLASTVVFVVAIVAFGGIVYLFTAPLVTGLHHLAQQLPTLIRESEHGRGRIGHLLVTFHLQRWASQNIPKLSKDITNSLKPAQALSVGAAAASTLVSLGTIAILALFILFEAPRIWKGVLGVLSPQRASRLNHVYHEVARSVGGYMLGNAVTSIVAGVIVYITLTILGVPFAGLLAVWVALVDLLPLVGGLLAGVPVVIIALIHSTPAGIVMLVVFIIYQQVENHLLNPLVMSKTVRMNPLWTLLAVLVGATLGDRIGAGLGAFIGALIGIPTGGAIQVVLKEIRRGGRVDQNGEHKPPA
ncbi:MAG: AI-2E family transporter [Actinobacteria bacterium]|nr:AI-2E family transporter [Actinomycetota bacterium]